MTLLVAQASTEIDPEAGEFNLFLFMLLVVFVVAIFVLAVIGFVVGFVIAATGGFLVISGAAVSSSVAAAVHKSPSFGFTIFVIQLSAVAGAILGALFGILYSYLNELPLLNLSYTGLAALVGFIVSALMGWMSVRLWLGICNQIQQWWISRRSSKTAESTNIPSFRIK